MRKKSLQRSAMRFLALNFLCFHAFLWANEKPEFVFGRELSSQLLATKIDEAKADAKLDEKTRNTVIELYLRAKSNLDAHAKNIAEITQYNSDLDAALRKIEILRADTKKLQKPAIDTIQLPDEASRLEIGTALLRAKSKLTLIETDVAQAQTRLEAARRNTPSTRVELVKAIDNRKLLPAVRSTIAFVDESSLIKRARRWLWESIELVRESDVKRLDQHMIHLTPRFAYLKAEVDWQRARLAQQQKVVNLLRPRWSQLRIRVARQNLAAAKASQVEATKKNSLVANIGSENVSIAKTTLRFVYESDHLSGEVIEADETLASLSDRFSNLRLMLQTAGINRSQGRMILESGDKMPDTRQIEKALSHRRKQLSEVILEKLAAEERLVGLKDVAVFADSLVRTGSVDEDRRAFRSDELPTVLATKGNKQRSLTQALVEESTYYRQTLIDFIQVQRQLLKLIYSYDELLAERTLWVRNAPDVDLRTLFAIPEDRLRYFRAGEFHRVHIELVDITKRHPLLLLGWLMAILLWFKRDHLRQRLAKTNQFLKHPVNDRYSRTVAALLITSLLAAPGPLVPGMYGAALYLYSYDTGMIAALGPALRWVALYTFLLTLIYQICQPYGLGPNHFQWRETGLQRLRPKLRLFALIFLPLGFVANFLGFLDPGASEWEYVRIFLIALFISVASLFVSVLRNASDSTMALRPNSHGLPFEKLRWLWLAVAILIAASLTVLVLLSYVDMAVTLFDYLLKSIALILLIVLCHQLGLRWLRVTTRRLKYQRWAEKQNDQSNVGLENQVVQDATAVHYDLPDVNVAELSRGSVRLLNMSLYLAGTIGLLAIWYPMMSALRFLERVQLWSVTKTVNGTELIHFITLSDLLLCILIVAFSSVLYKNLPALMKLLIYQILSVGRGVHYTAINLTLYIIIVCSSFAVANLLGFEWAKFQWLVAALGVGIGFGLQDLVANFISGFIILLERPIRVGDLVTIGQIEGFVTRIRLRATTIVTVDRQELLVPNRTFVSDNLLNWSLSDPITRLTVDVGIAYGSNVSRVRDIMISVAEANRLVLPEPRPSVIVDGFGNSALQLRLICFIDDIEARIQIRSNLHEDISHRLQEDGIDIAFPQLDLHLDPEHSLSVKLEP